MLEETKLFSIDEANATIGQLSLIFEEIFAFSVRAKNITKDINGLVSIWGQDLLEKGHTDHEFYNEKVKERTETHNKIKQRVQEIHETGAIVKDIELGLIDFYHKLGDEIVMLCWRFGEKEIKYWHTMEGGFRRRRHIEELTGEKNF